MKMKKIILSLLFTLSFLIVAPQFVFACELDADCPNGQVCKNNDYSNVGGKICVPGSRDIKPTDDSIFGKIEAPRGVAELNDQSEGGIGLILFISNLIKIVSIVAGVWTMFNFIFAGFTYITESGKSGSIEKIGNNLTMSVVGLAIIVASYTIAGVIGFLIFGDATYIISPTIPTAI